MNRRSNTGNQHQHQHVRKKIIAIEKNIMSSSDATTDPPKAAKAAASGKPVPSLKNVATAFPSGSPTKSGQPPSSPRLSICDVVSAKKMATKAKKQITSEDQIISGGDPEKEYLLSKKTQSMNYLQVLILAEEQQQKLSALHFDAVHDNVFFFPSVIITLMSGILAILVKSTLVTSGKTQTVIALVIAILSIVSTFFQSLMKQFDFSGRAGFHESCARALNKLFMFSKLEAREAAYNNIFKSLSTGKTLSVGKNKLAEEHHDESKGAKDDSKKPPAKKGKDDAKKEDDGKKKDDDEHKKDDGSLSAQFRQAVDTCDSVVPIEISSAFKIMRARLELVNKSTMIHKVHAKVDFSIILPSLIYALSNTIVSYKGFPIFLPDPEWAVDTTLKDWKKHLKNDVNNSADLLGDLIERSDMIRHLGEETAAPDDDAMV
mmetsp:Transcript_20178/g.22342  ORF Transcript_20178/g.22342 Transcript_20178/m.22342 type:complete len:432 (+) Transcript_20178:69-1364(+)